MENKTPLQRAEEKEQSKGKVKEFFHVGEVLGYFFRRHDPNRPKNFNIRAMHIINKIAIGLFIICLMIMLKRCVFGY